MNPNNRKISRRIWTAVVGFLIAMLIRLLRLTWRIRHEGPPAPHPCLYAFWHGDQIALAGAFLGRGITVLASPSFDGQLGSVAARLLGLKVVQGSTNEQAVVGARALIKRLRAGYSVAFAVDGPRGPYHCCRDSAWRLALLAPTALVPIVARARHGLQLSSWDGLFIPAPFSTIVVVSGPPLSANNLQQELDWRWQQACLMVGQISVDESST